MPPPKERLGLIAGNGQFPFLVLDAARAQGFDVVVAAIKEETLPEIALRGAAVVHWLSLAIIAVFGGATLILHDDTFIKWKPTVLYGLFAAVLLVGRVAFGRNLIGALLKDLTLPQAVWTRITWAWIAFFVFMGVANWYVAFHFSTDTWVNFKVWGAIVLFLLFAVGQALAVARHMPEQS